jgi:hypothetical protein
MRFGYLKFCVLACTLVGSVSVVSCGGSQLESAAVSDDQLDQGRLARAPKIESVAIVANGRIEQGVPIRFETFEAPELATLRSQEGLESVVAGASSEFEKMLLIKNWVAAQWPHGTPDPYPPWNALVVLDWIRGGTTGGFCAQYSQVLLQSLASLGMTARYVEIGSIENPTAHFIVEVWSNQHKKWVVLDSDFNVHFERRGIPLSALEIHDALLSGDLSEVLAIKGAFRDGHADPDSWPMKTAELYYYVRYHLKANHLSAPDEPQFDRFNDMIEWNDAATVPWELSTVPSIYLKDRLTNQVTNDRVAAEAPLNQVVMTVAEQSESEIILIFETNALEFRNYQIRLSSPRYQKNEWQDLGSATYRWRPDFRTRVLEVRAVNIRGIAGVSASLEANLVVNDNGGRAGLH